ncbi:MAG: Translation initiation factor IF-3 [candidate division CPR2 bacterium GW2011_GWC1_41_48]|uniref:Translation initiation factor IF-3 n=1 Tax=candidate division CPR2 bacterium GW2011_GWC1_41_48 TaxID=1618344 RepID=A0A0G0W8D2_UNCC2|nr:MAG: Translation initiation factor IF-3 [candidate division CPR2 bacterium GW2011_GWC2_39_35]KKR28434.1 MAG: Translation initiation factor IF-3 [candidate division CPR2 bacterium GW2011_GWD2_39_7]KKS09240.1 MAG: Translation initiation factor IF-3 [candidate division CPR2 bacterium GW2011_GWC1_41_48]
MRLIDETGTQIGVVQTREALKIAEEREYDLVEVSPTAKPPVAKLVDWDKYRYELKKQEEKQKKKQKTTEVKTIRLRLKIGEHDLVTKANHAYKFLEKGNKVKVSLMFRGREVVHKELGKNVVDKFFDKVKEVGDKESEPTFAGRELIMILTPKK